MQSIVGIGNKYITIEEAIKNGARDIIISSNIHIKSTLLFGYGKYNITISNSSLIYFDMDDCAISGKEFASLNISGGSIEIRSKILCTSNISITMNNVSLSCNGCNVDSINMVSSIVSGTILIDNSNMDNVTIEGELICNGGRNAIINSRLREDISIVNGKVIMDNCYIKNIKTSDGEIELTILNSEICNWICNRGTRLSLILQHNTIGCSLLPSLDNSLITYNKFISDINILYSYNSNIGYNTDGGLNIEFLRNSTIEHNNISSIVITHESSTSRIHGNICDGNINIVSSISNKITSNICSNISLDTLDKSKVKSNNVKNITIKYILQSIISCHTDTNISIICCVDSNICNNTCCDLNVETLTRSYYVGNYVDLTDDVNISNPTMSTISGNKSYQGDIGHIHIIGGSNNIIQDNCNITII